MESVNKTRIIRIRINHFDFLKLLKQFWKTVSLFDAQGKRAVNHQITLDTRYLVL